MNTRVETMESWGRDVRESRDTRRPWLPAGLVGLLATITMLFTAFISAYVVRRASGQLAGDWQMVALPSVLWASTAFVAIASVLLERARFALRAEAAVTARRSALGASLAGLGFVVCQLEAWRELAGAGVYLWSGPHASFFYMLTAVHGLHMLGGMILLGVVLLQLRRHATLSAGARGVGFCAAYWHLLAVVWFVLFALLSQL